MKLFRDRSTGLLSSPPEVRHLSVSLTPSALLSADLEYEAHEYNSAVSAICTYSAVNAFGTSNPEETTICGASNKMCSS